MGFPVWELGTFNQSLIIGIVAVFHIFIALLAVGAGFYLPVTEYIARRDGRTDLIEFLQDQTRFFVVLTSIFGAVSGVGIWFAISLCNPLATTALIHKFVFAWGVEYSVFFVEITALIFYYYGWKKMDPVVHQRIGWIYAASAFGSLVVINGILSYMLTPSAAPMTEVTNASFFASFFNPGYFPSLLMRTLVALALAGLFGLYMAAKLPYESELRTWLLRYSAKWLLPTYLLMVFAGLWFLSTVPQDTIQAMTGGITAAGVGNLSILTRVVMLIGLFTVSIALMVYFGPYKNPTEFTRWKALALLLSAWFVTGAGEWSREVARKPYVIRDFMYVNGVLAQGSSGYAHDLEDPARYQQSFLPRVGWRSTTDVGELMFENQCLGCHTLGGYRSLPDYLVGFDENTIELFLKNMQRGKENPYRMIMPPLIGDESEVRALAAYLHAQLPVGTTGGH